MSDFTRSQSCCAWCIVAAGLIPVLAASGTVHSQGQEAAVGTVDDARLLAAGDQDDRNWITFGQDYSNQRFSALTQINRTTSGASCRPGSFRPAWSGRFRQRLW